MKRQKKHYDGQLSSGFGYGGIVRWDKYTEQRYGNRIRQEEYKILSMDSFVTGDFERNANNCVLTAITRVLKYYEHKGCHKIDADKFQIYSVVKQESEKYGYTVEKGVGFHRIRKVISRVVRRCGYSKHQVKSRYCIGLFHQIQKEINAGRPVVMNISFGYYRNHTITVCGYYMFTKEKRIGPWTMKKKYKMLAVYDGWRRSVMYLDYHAFCVPASITKLNIYAG